MTQIGPTGDPRRTRDANDQGGLRAGMKVEPDGHIKLDFGTSLSFLRMTKLQAEHFGRSLLALSQTLPPGKVSLEAAFDESVKLQSHYAGLLNQYDGGHRLQFESTGDWINRLEKLAMEKQ